MIVGWIGLGRMGRPMALRLLAGGHELHVWSRRAGGSADLLAAGARSAPGIADLAGLSDVLFTMVGGPADIRTLYGGDDGILASIRPGTLIIDCTTSSPALARELAGDVAAVGAGILDAPVSGGPAGAERGDLSIMVGGVEADLAAARPLLEILGTTIVHHGPAGAGQAAKLVNQVLLAGSMAGIVEAFEAASRLGLDPDMALRSLEAGIGRSPLLAYVWSRLSLSDLAPGFRVTHMVKDLALALEATAHPDAPLEATEGVLARYRLLESDGYGDAGTQALFLTTRGIGWPTDPADPTRIG